MKTEKNLKRKIMLLGILTLLLTSCGGGGGGGGGSSNLPIKPSTPSIPGKPSVPSVPDKPGTPTPIIPGNFTNLDKSNMPELKKNLYNKQSITAASIPSDIRVLDGNQIKVAILDSDFKYNHIYNDHFEAVDNLNSNYSIEVLDRPSWDTKHSKSPHGEQVLEVLADRNVRYTGKVAGKEKFITSNKTNLKIIAASIGSGGDAIADKRTTANLDTYRNILSRFGSQKVKIFNQSWGSEKTIMDPEYKGKDLRNYIFDAKDDTGYVNFFEDVVENKGGFFVWAAGNAPQNDVTLEAGLPYFNKKLEKGWIAAIGIIGEETKLVGGVTKPTGRMNLHDNPHLNYPGEEAKWWSISADAKSIFWPTKGTEGRGYSYGIGSSYAAPKVSRAAALVSEKFDWMTPNQIRQTLFTTTDKTEINSSLSMGERRRVEMTPDAKYGWGMLNQDRALKGPGAFLNIENYGNSLSFNANIPSGKVSYFENKIFGIGGLIKNGAGTLHLTNDNSYSGGSVVNAGTLEIHKIHSSEVTVKAAGKLILHPKSLVGYNEAFFNIIKTIDPQKITTNTDLNNYGKVEIKGTTAIVGGNYIAHKGSTTTFNSGAKLNVLGNIKIENGTVKVLSDKYVTQGEKSTLMEGKTFEGSIANVEVNGMRVANVEANDGKLVAELSRQNPVDYLGNAEASSMNVAQNVENIFADLDKKVKAGTASQEELAMAATMQTMSARTFSAATEKMSGEIYASAQALTFSQAQNINRDLSNRLAGLDNLKLSSGESQTWFSAIGSDGKLRRDGYASADTRVAGGQFGLDKKINSNTNLGVALAYSHAKADFNKYAGNSKSDMVGVSLYGKQDWADNFYAAGRLGISHVSTKVERELIDGVGNTVQGRVKHDDIMSSVYLEVGKSFKWLTPFVGYSQDYLRRGSFSESNAAWGIHADSKNYWNSNFLVGLRAEFALNKYKFQTYITQAINVGERDLAYEGHFTGSTVKQKYQGIKQAKNTTWLGLGIFREVTTNFGIYGNVDFRMEDSKRVDSVFSAGLQYKF